MSKKLTHVAVPKFDEKMTVRSYALKLQELRPEKSSVGVGTKNVNMYSFKVSQLISIVSEEDPFWKESVDDLTESFVRMVGEEGKDLGEVFPGVMMIRVHLSTPQNEIAQVKITSGISNRITDIGELKRELTQKLRAIRAKIKPSTFGKIWNTDVFLDYMDESSIAFNYVFV